MPNDLASNGRLFLPAGYTQREQVEYCDDDIIARQGITWQQEVYEKALWLARRLRSGWVVDLGCGDGTKLARLALEFQTLGVDYGGNLEWARRTHPSLEWFEADLDSSAIRLPISEVEVAHGMVFICADVIEHLRDPRPLLMLVARYVMRGAAAVISTPDRLVVREPGHIGPPPNTHHYREWAPLEFHALLLACGLPVPGDIEHVQSSSNNPLLGTMLAVCHNLEKELA